MRPDTTAAPTVAIVSDAIWPYHKGGKEIRYHQLVPRLARQGVDVHVFTMRWWDGGDRRECNGVRYTAISPRLDLYVGERRSIVQAVVFSLCCLRLLRHRLDAIDADQMPYLPLFPLRLVATIKRVPLIVTWHEVWGPASWSRYLGRAGAVAAALERWAMRLPDLVVAVDDETRDRLVAGGVPGDRVAVVPNGVDLDLVDASSPSATRFDLVFVGRLVEHKRVADLLDAIALLAADGTTVTCAIVGTGPERTRLEHRADALGIAGQVRFLGSLDEHRTVYGLVKSAGCFVLPSVREGFGIVVVEALACGVPVITTHHPDNQSRRLVEHGVTGWLCEPTAQGLADAIRRSLDGPFDVGRAEHTLERCDWDRIAGRLVGLYEGARWAA